MNYKFKSIIHKDAMDLLLAQEPDQSKNETICLERNNLILTMMNHFTYKIKECGCCDNLYIEFFYTK